jgi:TIR domain
MAGEPQTKWDIFVSYRHVADESDEKWVTEFCKGLKIKIDDLLGEKITVWLDSAQLRAGDEWRPEIDQALESTAIFLAIISQSYFRSEVCRQEMDRFLGLYKQANEATPRLIFPIFKQPPTPDVPPDINEIHRPRVFYQDNPPGYDEFAPGRKTNNDFWDALAKVAQELKVQLEKIHERVRPRTLGTVYLAEVGRELQRERDNLQADLFQRRYGVLPDKSYMWNASNIGDTIEAYLNSADVCVHLIGRTTPIRPDTLVHTKDQIDRAVEAMSLRGRPAPLVWIQPGGEPEDGTLRALIDYVKTELPDRGVDFFECSLEDFKSHVVSKLPKAPIPTTPAASGASNVAVLHDSSDVVASKALKLVLVDQLNCEPLPIRVSESGAFAPEGTAKMPEHCDHCIIFWGAQPESWVREVLALDGVARYLGKERLCLYIAPPDSDEKEGFVTGKARTISAASVGTYQTELRAFLGAKKA